MKNIYIGIDNGVSGSVGILDGPDYHFWKVPTISQQNYTKKKGNITRINHPKLKKWLRLWKGNNVFMMIERPMVNPTRFKATTSALRSLESVLIAVEALKFRIEYIDSKEWQKELLPKGVKGSPELKKASHDIGLRLFPKEATTIKKQKDADGILIAEYCRRKCK